MTDVGRIRTGLERRGGEEAWRWNRIVRVSRCTTDVCVSCIDGSISLKSRYMQHPTWITPPFRALEKCDDLFDILTLLSPANLTVLSGAFACGRRVSLSRREAACSGQRSALLHPGGSLSLSVLRRKRSSLLHECLVHRRSRNPLRVQRRAPPLRRDSLDTPPRPC